MSACSHHEDSLERMNRELETAGCKLPDGPERQKSQLFLVTIMVDGGGNFIKKKRHGLIV